MKAIVHTRYGSPDVLQFIEMPVPTPKENEVLIEVRAASLNQYDWHLLTADIFLVRFMGGGLFRPQKTLVGADVAGRVVAVGREVKQFQPGDEVFGDIAGSDSGSLAEYATAPEIALVKKPVNLSFEEAAAVPMAAFTALQGMRDVGQVQPGQKVAINGASGGVGTFAVQIAKFYGAEVTAVCSPRNLEQARAIGADHVIDYTKEDFTKNGQQYDVIFAANGYHPISAYQRALAPQGIYACAGGTFPQLFQAMLLGARLSKPGGKKMGMVSAKSSQADLAFLKDLLEAGKIAPVIDKRYPLSETAEAMRYLGTGHARAKLVISMAHEGK